MIIYGRKIDVKLNTLTLVDNQIEQILDRVVTPFGNSAKADVPKNISEKEFMLLLQNSFVPEPK